MNYKAVVQLQRGVMTLSEAAEWLGISEYDLRLRVRQKIIRPMNFESDDKLLYLKDGLYFKREEIEAQWRDFISVERDLRDQVLYLVTVVRQLAIDIQSIKSRVELPELIDLKSLSKYLGVHPVTLRKKVISSDGVFGKIVIEGHGSLDCRKIEHSWRVASEDVKKLLRI